MPLSNFWTRIEHGNLGIRPNTFGLIRAIGLDCAGGALFAPSEKLDAALARKGTTQPLDERQIGSHLRLLRQDETAWHEDDDEHWSLAGSHRKLPSGCS